MAEWKKDIARLGFDFLLNRYEILNILRTVEDKYSTSNIPSYYNNNRGEYMYDKAQSMIMCQIGG